MISTPFEHSNAYIAKPNYRYDCRLQNYIIVGTQYSVWHTFQCRDIAELSLSEFIFICRFDKRRFATVDPGGIVCGIHSRLDIELKWPAHGNIRIDNEQCLQTNICVWPTAGPATKHNKCKVNDPRLAARTQNAARMPIISWAWRNIICMQTHVHRNYVVFNDFSSGADAACEVHRIHMPPNGPLQLPAVTRQRRQRCGWTGCGDFCAASASKWMECGDERRLWSVSMRDHDHLSRTHLQCTWYWKKRKNTLPNMVWCTPVWHSVGPK